MKKEIKRILEKIKSLGWVVDIDNSNEYVTLSKFSPYGHDFNIDIHIEENGNDFIYNIYKCYEEFDVSYETYLWLDNEGHGKNGAPYDMKDVYEDMVACQNFIYELYINL